VATVQGFLLLSLSNVSLISPSIKDSGTLALECVTLPVSSGDRDVWLVLRLNNFEMPIAPNQVIRHSRANHTFIFEAPTGDVILHLRAPSTPSEAEDVETLEVILAQYGVLIAEDPDGKNSERDGDLKGRLALVDEDNGEVVGTLGDQFKIREDASLGVKGREKDPVVIDIPDGDVVGSEMYVYGIPYEQEDTLMKGAALLRYVPQLDTSVT